MTEAPPYDRDERRTTFDAAADLYQRARPDHPEHVYEDIERVAGLQPGLSHLLEIGPATGKATMPFARRSYRITAVELGANLAAAARRNLAEFPDVTVLHANIETYEPPDRQTFDLVYAANVWGWLDPDTRCEKAWRLLGNGGHLALWGQAHVCPDAGDRFFRDIQEIYEEIGEGLPPDATWTQPGAVDGHATELAASGRFQTIFTNQFDWEIVYDVDSYLDLLNTFSGHIAMQPWQRDRLYGEIRDRLAQRPDGLVRRHWGGVLEIARRIS